MANKPLKHNLALNFQGKNAPFVPLELVEHETGFAGGKSRIYIVGRKIVEIIARDVARERGFFLAIGEENGDVINVGSALPKWQINIGITEHKDAPIDPPLDIMGNAALAFYSTDAEEDKDRLVKAGGRMATNPFAMHIQGKSMLICMLRSPEGTIVELIQVRRRA